MNAAPDTFGQGRLPEDVTSFVGRQRATSEVRRLLTESRLVTLTGAGGVGKTRLAIQVARQVRRAIPDGVWLVELAKLTDPSQVATTVMTALGVSDSTTRDAIEALIAYLADKRLLLVLDNCEHLLPACTQLTATLLPAAPKLHILATSREPLGVLGEQIWPVPPLSLPDPDTDHDGSQQYEALTLFKDRATAVGFTVDATNRQAVAELCRQLDGLPLGIELAAAVWLRTLSVEQILTRLPQRFHLPAAGRGVPTRHQTLRATVEWSYDLCTPLERRLWARLSIFTGEFDLDAAEHICADNEVTLTDVLTGIAGLIDKSILVRGTQEPLARYRMLDTIREYGTHRLAGQTADLRRRHRDYYLSLAEQADAESCSPRQSDWIMCLRTERPNIWAALDYCLTTPGESRTALRMAGALWLYWVGCGFVRDGRHWLDRALALDTEPTPERARALWLNGWLALLQGDNASLTPIQQACELAERLGAERELAHAIEFLGAWEMVAGNLTDAVSKLDEALRRHRESGGWTAPGLVTFVIRARVAILSGDVVEHDFPLLDECVAICDSLGERWLRSWAEWDLGITYWVTRNLEAAAAHFREGLRRGFGIDNQLGMTFCIEGIGWTAAAAGDMRRAATLFGAADQGWKFATKPMFGLATYLGWWEQCRTRCRQALGEETFDTARQRGARLTPEQIIATAQGEKTPTPATPPTEQILTKREREVAALIAQGKSNKDIATTLVIAQRTVEGHVEHILRKLGATSRAQIAAWVIARHRDE